MLHELKLRLQALLHRRRFNRDVEDELAFHLAMREEKLREQGVDPSAAQRRFGNTARIAENLRDMRGWGAAERLWQDLGFALRLLRAHRGFTAAAILPLALAIGGVAAVSTLADAVLFRPTGIRDPGHVAAIYTFSRSQGRYLGGGDSYPDFRDISALGS
ncbi:MAG TPA: permease prefix domain 1-containing protein, partial [Bryobacteraceae bacterium]|nr:permease prefix domain 1-containing protein [Bryobacteraceae bacterium]